jgi:hypothetical protein
MPHSDLLLPAGLRAGLASGTQRQDQFGLTVVTVGVGTPPTRPPPLPHFSELDPPDPGALVATNPGTWPVTVSVGQMVAGLMADRAVTTLVILPAGATMIVPVEPLSARWWQQGRQPSRAGRLPPALAALLILAGEGSAGLRSVARTALWEGYRRQGVDTEVGAQSAWVLLRGRTPLAAHLVLRRGLELEPEPRPQQSSSASPAPLGQPGGAECGVVRLAHRRGSFVEVWVVRASLDLPDAVISAPAD